MGHERLLLLTRLALDLISIAIAAALAGVLRFSFGLLEVVEAEALTVRSHVSAGGAWVAAFLCVLAVNRMYDEDTLYPGGGEVTRLVRSTLEATSIMAILVFFTQSFYVSRTWLALTIVLSLTLIALQRRIVRGALARRREDGSFRRDAIVVSGAADPEAPAWIEDFGEFAIVDAVAMEDLIERLEDPDRARAAPWRPGAALLVMDTDVAEDELWRLVVLAGQQGHPVFVRARVRSLGRDRLTFRDIGGHAIVRIAPPGFIGLRGFQKRVFDVVGSVLLLTLMLPLMIVVALAILITSGTPIFYAQDRVGLAGRTFKMFKFRTMRSDAETETGPVWSTEDDPRRTRVGRVLRRSSLDELPQLVNVLAGDMSLVGPRPERPTFVDRFSQELEWYRYRLRLRPGVTGWAQIHGLRGNTSLEERIRFDNWYIEHWSISLDIKILIGTIREIAAGRNAY